MKTRDSLTILPEGLLTCLGAYTTLSDFTNGYVLCIIIFCPLDIIITNYRYAYAQARVYVD